VPGGAVARNLLLLVTYCFCELDKGTGGSVRTYLLGMHIVRGGFRNPGPGMLALFTGV
jgi:hypothetical protein